MNEEVLSCKKVVGIVEKIEAIPQAMRHMGWSVSADLMERWLHSGAWVLPPVWKSISPPDPQTLSPENVDERTVRMSWALSHGQIKHAMNNLRSRMTNGPARALLASRLKEASWGSDNRITVGSLQESAIRLESLSQCNVQTFGRDLDTLDDFYGSIGKGTLKVAFIGHAERSPITGAIIFHATHAGFYIRDAYDFTGFQYLGTWTDTGVLTKSQTLINAALDGMVFRLGGKPIGNVFNHDFETYRCLTGFGGDFMIYSDVHWERVDLRLDLT